MSNKFSFKEEAQQQIISLYQSAIEDTNSETQKYLDKMNALCEKTKFLPMVNAANDSIKFYNETLRYDIKKYFGDWVESESSLHAFIETMEGGEDAYRTAVGLERSLENVIDEMFASPLEELHVATDTPDVSKEDYELLIDYTKDYSNKLEEIKSKYLTTIENEGEENTAFYTIQAVVAETLDSIIGTFEEFANKVDMLRDDFSEKLNINIQRSDDVKQAMSNVVQESAEKFRGLSGIFKA
ncbi:MAG TPA: hypothetical protein GX396_01315 [Tissierellia bacterium]|nr:hypothetical protein [Tissierellia bacterium]